MQFQRIFGRLTCRNDQSMRERKIAHRFPEIDQHDRAVTDSTVDSMKAESDHFPCPLSIIDDD